MNVIGDGYEHLTSKHREEILKAFPRNDFKNKIIPTFFNGFEHKTETTSGNIKADVCASMIPNLNQKISATVFYILLGQNSKKSIILTTS